MVTVDDNLMHIIYKNNCRGPIYLDSNRWGGVCGWVKFVVVDTRWLGVNGM